MSTNPFALSNIEQEGSAAAPATDNPFALQSIRRDQQQDLRVELQRAVRTNPDHAAEVDRLAQRYPAPKDVLLRNLQDVQLQAAVDTADEKLGGSPKLADYMRTSPWVAKQSHDDLDALTQVAQFFSDTGGSVKAGVFNAAKGASGLGRGAAEFVAPPLDILEGVTAIGGNPLRRLAEGFAMLAEQNAASAKAVTPKTTGNLDSGFQSGVQSLTQNLLALPMAFMGPGGQSAALTMMTANTGGNAYQDAREKGLPMSQAIPFAAAQSAVEYATEKLPLGALLKDVKAGTPFLETLARQVAMEVPGEQVATILQDLNEWAVLNPDKPFTSYLDERPSAAAQTLVATIVGAGGNVAVMKGIEKALTMGTDNAAKIADAERVSTNLQTAMQAAAASKLRERNPETFKQLVQHLADNGEGAPTSVFIDAQVLAQSGVNVAEVFPSAADQMEAALATNGSVEVAISEVLTAAPGTPLEQVFLQNARGTADGISMAEAEQAFKQADQWKAEADRVMAEAQDQAAWQQSADNVKANLLGQLNTAGRFTADVNEAYATMVRDFYATMAGRQGITPEEMYQRYPLRIAAQGVGGQQLDQEQQTVIYHGTTPEAAAAIERDGFDITKSADGTIWFTSNPDIGEVAASGSGGIVKRAFRESGLKLGGWDETDRYSTDELIAMGYDGLKLEDAGETTYQIFKPEKLEAVTGELNQSKQDPQRDLVVTHNLTADNLLHAVKMGGIAVPSLAVTKKDNPLTGFGEITLIGSPEMADPKGYAGTKVFGADIYSPRYPSVTFEFTPKARRQGETVLKDGMAATGTTYLDWSEVERDGARELERLPAVLWQFLKSKGVEPAVVRTEPKSLPAQLQPFKDDTRHSHELAADPAFTEAVWSAQLEMLTQAYGGDAEAVTDATKEVEKLKATAAERGRSQLVNSYANSVQQYQRDARAAGRIDSDATRRALQNQVREANLNVELRDYAAAIVTDLNPNERIFQGFTASGNRKYIPHTLDNVVKLLKKELRGGENFNYGVGSLRAKFTPQFKSVADIRKNKDRLISAADFDKIKDDINTEFLNMASAMSIPSETLSAIMEDATKMGVQRAAAQYKVDVGGDRDVQIAGFMTRLRNLPTAYFEAKIMREVDLAEFAGAVVPEGVKPEVLKALQDRGVKDIRTYKKGDEADRAVRIGEFENQFFQGARGTFNPEQILLTLNANADLSTFLHESGHFFLEVMADLASQPNAPTDVTDDMAKLLKWFGVADAATWNAMTLDQKRPHHERFAESFEQYLLEGKAPSAELQPLFRRFRAWMVNVYKSLTHFMRGRDLKLSDEVRQVFDRMLAAEEAITQQEEASGLLPDFDATNEAIEKLQARSLRDLKWTVNARSRALKALQKEAANLRKAVEDEVRAEVEDRPEVKAKRALDELRKSTPEYKAALADWKAQRQGVVDTAAEDIKTNLLATEGAGLKGIQKGQFLAKNKRRIANEAEARALVWERDNAKPERQIVGSDTEIATVADAFGYESTDAMLAAIDQFGDIKAAVEGMTDQRMLENFGELATPEAIEEAANDAVHNEARAKSLATELKAQADMLNTREQVGADAEADAVIAVTKPITPDAARKAVAGKTEKPSGVDPVTWLDDGREYRVGDVPLELFVDNEEPGKYDGTVNAERAADYAARNPADAPPVIATQGRTGGKLRIMDGGHRISAARLRGDKTIKAIVRVKTKAASNGSKITVNALTKAAKEFAANLAARRKVKDLKGAAAQHRAAEAKAGKRWQEATAKADTQAAVAAKRDQVLNNATVKALNEAQAEARKIVEFFRKVTKDGNEKLVDKGRDPDVVNAMRAILAAYDVAPRLEKGALEYMELVAKNDPTMYGALQPGVQGAMNNAKPLAEMTMEELRGLHDELQAMWHLAKRSRQMEVDGNLMDIQDAADELVTRLDTVGIPLTIPGERAAITPGEEFGIKLQFVKSILSRVEQWAERLDGKFGGPFLRLVFQPVKDAADRYRTDKTTYRTKFTELVKNVAPSLPDGFIDAPELGYKFGNGKDSGAAELLHAILHTGNDSNKRKLLLGRGWATENADGTLDTAKWDAFITRMIDTGKLTKAHYDFAQGVWDLLEEMKPLAQETHRKVFGRYFAEVTANGFDTPFGPYRGGYVPAQTDSRLVKDAKLRELAEGENESMAYAFPSSPSGFTKGRVEYNKPLLLDLRALAQHMDKVLLFSHMQGAVTDVRRLLTDKRVSYALDRIDPGAYEGMLIPWLNRAAKQIVETPVAGDRKLSRFLSSARSRSGMALMFANLSNTVQQITGFSSAAVKVKPGLIMSALSTFTASPKAMREAVVQASPFMKDRMQNEVSAMNNVVEEILVNPTLLERSQAWTQKHAYFMQSAADNTMAPIIWTAAYNQSIAQQMEHSEAVRFADGVVRQTQGSTLPEDVSRFETGPAMVRVFTQFIGYFNMMANTNATAMSQIVDDVGLRKGAGKLLYVALAGLLAPIWVAEAISQAFKGGPDDEDRDGWLDDWLMAVFGLGTLKGLTATVPIVGQGAQLVVNRFNSNPADDKFSLSPAVSLIESAVSAPSSVYKAITDDGNVQKAVRDVAAAATMATGLPFYAAARPVGYLAGVAQGKIEPTSGVDAVRGVLTGTASKESKQ